MMDSSLLNLLGLRVTDDGADVERQFPGAGRLEPHEMTQDALFRHGLSDPIVTNSALEMLGVEPPSSPQFSGARPMGGWDYNRNPGGMMQFAGLLSSQEQPGAKGYGGGGRVGIHTATENGLLQMGLLARLMRMKIDTPQGGKTFSKRDVAGADASYTSGPNTFGATYSKPGANPLMDGLRLYYRREF